MPLTITTGAAAKAASSGPGWVAPIVAVLIGALAALAAQLVIQLYVVPRVETRKRREDRWERDVRELGQLLTTSLTDRANELHAAQFVYRDARGTSGNPALIARLAKEAEQVVFEYGSLIHTQVDWLIAQILRLDPEAPEIKQLDAVWLDYRVRTIEVRPIPEHDTRTDDEFDESWEKERAARKTLIEQVKVLADLPHPPYPQRVRQGARPTGERFDLLGGPDPE
jgi:hypothetical protein